jgi:CheY-like chemotaxis protein
MWHPPDPGTLFTVETIALIDSDPDDLALLTQVLSDEGYSVVTHLADSELKSPGRVLDFIKEQRPDLIIADPFGGGWDFDLKALWTVRHNVQTRYVPLIVCTAHSGELHFRQGTLRVLNAGIVRKPFTRQQLLEAVQASLSRH